MHKAFPLPARVQFLEDRQREGINLSGDDAPIKGKRLDEEEVATERVSSDTEEIRLDEGEVAAERVTSVLSSRGVQVVPTAAAVALANVSISTGSRVVPTASTTISTATPIFSTATIVTPYTRRKGKEKIIETHTPKKKKRLQEQIDIQFAIELEEELEREAQRMNAQISKDEEITKIHAEEELQQMIEEVEAKFKTVLEQIEGGVSKIYEGEAAWLKRKGIRSEQESEKKHKTSEEVPEEVKYSNEVPEEKIKELIRLVPIEEGRIVGNKMHKAFPLPVTEFPLPEELPTAKEDSCHCQKKREATARNIALLSMSRRNCQSKVAVTLS
nr:hypothetical protein [Tanacetum cinerariifolium]